MIFIASTAGTAALEEHLAYGVAKAALIHMASILAVQLGPHNVRVNTVSPGVIAARGLDSEAWADGERARVVTGKTPLQRPGTPDEIAGCVVWLALAVGRVRHGQGLRGRRRSDAQGHGRPPRVHRHAARRRTTGIA